ncbi:hypothetical protein ACLB2K_018434 [Fragaria x ananassa]
MAAFVIDQEGELKGISAGLIIHGGDSPNDRSFSVRTLEAKIERPCRGEANQLRTDPSRFRTRLYSSQRKATSSRPRKKKSVMDPPEKDAFYVIRKGNAVGVYKSLADCQAQQGSSICDPPVSVYKGYSMPKKDEQYLASCGLQNALYTISAADMKDELFGKLVDCPCLDPAASEGETSGKTAAKKRSHQEAESENVEVIGSASVSDTPSRKQAKKKAEVEVPPSGRGCTLQFDGVSKGNPGTAGAGAVLRADDGTLI